ncbi:DUF1499 domain-containing protein [Geobacter argillaceus]|uniref:Uncharacterized protein DUF1499 n=1 Tax=Geobacter argillaceus TaxID=345631 RepID=A0A562VJU5_9BACT|nr:DUF1499 domain-containing protein [Geobacter argillaceus]TWJ18256.1 uncharacterized protein DUF1499 [Geobacter argillaceus]
MAEHRPTVPTRPDTRRGAALPVAGILLVLVAAILLVAAGFGTRLGLWHFRTGFDLLRYGSYCGAVAFLIALVAALLSFRGRRLAGFILALVAMICGLLITAIPVAWKLEAGRLPRIHDITTDTTNPPDFVAILPLRADAANPATYGGPEVAALQRRAYPDIKTVILEHPQAQAFEAALSAARALGWQVVATVPAAGRIEATATTFWFGFKDDIVIRVAPAGNRSRVDIRSVSRVGISDVGTNAKRIRAFVKKLTG